MRGELKGIEVDYDLDDDEKEESTPIEDRSSPTKSKKDKEK